MGLQLGAAHGRKGFEVAASTWTSTPCAAVGHGVIELLSPAQVGEHADSSSSWWRTTSRWTSGSPIGLLSGSHAARSSASPAPLAETAGDGEIAAPRAIGVLDCPVVLARRPPQRHRDKLCGRRGTIAGARPAGAAA